MLTTRQEYPQYNNSSSLQLVTDQINEIKSVLDSCFKVQ